MTLDKDRLSCDHKVITLVQLFPKIGCFIKKTIKIVSCILICLIGEYVYSISIRLYQDPPHLMCLKTVLLIIWLVMLLFYQRCVPWKLTKENCVLDLISFYNLIRKKVWSFYLKVISINLITCLSTRNKYGHILYTYGKKVSSRYLWS